MWQHFTENARRTVYEGQEVAKKFGDVKVSPEHLLVGLLVNEENSACRILRHLGHDPTQIREILNDGLAKDVMEQVNPEEMGLSDRGKRIIDYTYDGRRNLHHPHIGTEHLLLGLIRVGQGFSGEVLTKSGIDLQSVRKEAAILHPNYPQREQTFWEWLRGFITKG